MHIAAVVLGILAVLCAAALTFLFGTTGVIITAVLGAGTVALGILAKVRTNSQKGGHGILMGIIAVALAFSINDGMSNLFTEMHRNALEYKPDGLWAQVSENTSHGVMGIISALPKDEATLNALVEEINELNRLTEQKEQTDSSVHRTWPQSVWSIQKGTANHSGSFLNGIRCPGMQNSLSRSDCTRHMALPCPDNRIRMVQSFPGHRAKRKAYRLFMSRNSSAGFGPQDALPMPDCA